jgi:hypothetical protein
MQISSGSGVECEPQSAGPTSEPMACRLALHGLGRKSERVLQSAFPIGKAQWEEADLD